MTDLLDPYRALDLTDEKGMLCGKILAFLGTDVIKVEAPNGDSARCLGPFVNDIPDPENSLFWLDSNVNKRGITLNLEIQDARQLLKDLVKHTDFLIESFDPGYLKKLGLGYAVLSSINPHLIMVSITPFGQDGPKAHYNTTELTRWASTGVMYCTGEPDRAPNWISCVPQARIHAGLEASLSALAALYYRHATGKGQYIDISVQMSALDALMDTPEMWDVLGKDYQRHGIADNFGRVIQRFGLQCKDGYVSFNMIGGGLLVSAENLNKVREWILEEGDAPEWFRRMDFIRDYESKVINQALVDQVESIIESFISTKTKEEIYARALKEQLLAAPIQNAKGVLKDKQLETRGFWAMLRHEESMGRLPYPNTIARYNKTPIKLKRPAPRIGEHNEEVYIGELGLSEEQYVSLKTNNAI